MPHVDEGTLHAYLDGELSSADRKTVETHLAECASCRATLAEARALLERASALLGSVRPAVRPAPPFDQLRPRASQRARWHVRTPVAWAASIVLAVALGYYLREPGTAGAPGAPGATAQLQERRDVAAYHFQQSDSTQPIEENKPSRAQLRPSAPPVPAVAGAAAQAQRLAAGPDSAVVAERAAKTPALSRADSAAAATGVLALKSSPQLRYASPAAVARQRSADSLAAGARAADSTVNTLEEGVVTGVPQAGAQNAVVRIQPTTTQWPIISHGAARTLLGTDPVGLPGLVTRRIRRSPAPDGMVVVEQALDSSTMIEIYQRRADPPVHVDGVLVPQAERDKAERETAPSAAPAPADRLARYVGRLRVEIAGPLSPDSLNKLLDQVQPLP